RVPVRLLRSVRQPLLAQMLDGPLEVPRGSLQGRLAVHHARSRTVAELLHHFRGRRHPDWPPYAPVSTGACISASLTSGRRGAPSVSSAASASSFAKLPAPSRTASATRAVMRRTARMASSLPGTG